MTVADQGGPTPAPAHCDACPLRTLTPYGGIHPEEGARLIRLRRRTWHVPANSDVMRVGDDPAEVATLFSGWAYRYVRFPDGARQILSIVLPGETVGLSTLPGGRMSHAVASLTACTFCCLDKAALRDYLSEDQTACQKVFRAVVRRRDRSERQMALLGRRLARQRVAALLGDLHARLRQIGLAGETEFPFPLRHTHVADLVGLTPIHTSRVFRDLAADRIVQRRGRRIRVLDAERLTALSGAVADAMPSRAG
jgi:CRP-like cAMP-binding protein